MARAAARGDRVAVLAPSGADARVIEGLLAHADIRTTRCHDARALARELDAGAGAAVVAEEALDRGCLDLLEEVLASQPDWSDLPLILLTVVGRDAGVLVDRFWERTRQRLTVLERPVRSTTLLAALQAALRSRSRQYQMRDELARRREAEGALRRSEERLRRAQRAGGVGVWEIDPRSGRTFWSETMWELFGLAPQPADDPAARFAGALHPEDADRVRTQVEACLRGESDRVHGEFRIVRPDGSIRWIESIADVEAGPDDGGRTLCGVNIDVTARRRAADELREQAAALEEQNRKRDVFLATLGHELRNPLAALALQLQLLDEGLADGPGTHRKMASHVRQLTALVNDLLEVARITRGKLALRKTRMDLAAVVRAASRAVESDVRAKRQALSLRMPKRLPVEGDPIRLEQVACNLLANASRYTPPDGRIEVRLEAAGAEAVLSVRDSGQGLGADEIERLFEPFVQGDPYKGGLGIGLAMVKGLVELHDGSVTVQSEGPGRGCTFTVRVPVGDPAGSRARPRRPPLRSLARALRILVVDDNRDFADSLAVVLDRMGAETRCVHTGRDGIAEARRWSPEVAIVDVGLPDVMGYDVARALRSQDDGTLRLLLGVTGFGDDASLREARRAGFDELLVKPVDPEVLGGLLRRIATGGRANATRPTGAPWPSA